MKKIKKTFILIVLVAVILFALVMCVSLSKTKVDVETVETMTESPLSVERIQQIGEWEFLSIEDEEIVDTVRRGLWGNEELVRIYYGTLRIGIDLRELNANSFIEHGDTIDTQLPPVKLLDENFIDEARTSSFYVSGSWNNEAREALYKKAREMMMNRCLTKENMDQAHENAVASVTQLLQVMTNKKVNAR